MKMKCLFILLIIPLLFTFCKQESDSEHYINGDAKGREKDYVGAIEEYSNLKLLISQTKMFFLFVFFPKEY